MHSPDYPDVGNTGGPQLHLIDSGQVKMNRMGNGQYQNGGPLRDRPRNSRLRSKVRLPPAGSADLSSSRHSASRIVVATIRSAVPRQPACIAATTWVAGSTSRIGTQSAVLTPTSTPGRSEISASPCRSVTQASRTRCGMNLPGYGRFLRGRLSNAPRSRRPGHSRSAKMGAVITLFSAYTL